MWEAPDRAYGADEDARDLGDRYAAMNNAQMAALPARSDDIRPRMINSNALQHGETTRIACSWAADAASGSYHVIPVDTTCARVGKKHGFKDPERTEHSNQTVDGAMMVAPDRKRLCSLACSSQADDAPRSATTVESSDLASSVPRLGSSHPLRGRKRRRAADSVAVGSASGACREDGSVSAETMGGHGDVAAGPDTGESWREHVWEVPDRAKVAEDVRDLGDVRDGAVDDLGDVNVATTITDLGSHVCTQKSDCKDCGGSQICTHGKQKSYCKDCGGSRFCTHGKLKSRCKECKVSLQAAQG